MSVIEICFHPPDSGLFINEVLPDMGGIFKLSKADVLLVVLLSKAIFLSVSNNNTSLLTFRTR